jgi:hypothetical protein
MKRGNSKVSKQEVKRENKKRKQLRFPKYQRQRRLIVDSVLQLHATRKVSPRNLHRSEMCPPCVAYMTSIVVVTS